MSWGPPLDQSVWTLLNEALELYHDRDPAAEQLRHHLSRFEEPLRLAVAGPWQAGKSTLVNALVGESVAPIAIARQLRSGSQASDLPQLFAWYEDAADPYAIAYPPGQELPIGRTAGGMSVEVGAWQPAPVNDIVVGWPARTLRHCSLVDCPALPPGDGEAEPTAEKVLRDADAVLYLTRDARDADLRFLEHAQEGGVARAAPVNLLLVLSRADEFGGGRVDALLAARQLARSRQREPRIRARCLGVVAVSGQVACAGRSLSETDFAALAALAATGRAELDSLLLSTDRFLGPECPAPVGVDAREALLDKLGIFGVRLATTLIRNGSNSRGALAAELVRRAGLAELRELIARCFTDRRGVLKARSALVALESLLRNEPRAGAERLIAVIEHIVANAHDFRELRLLASLQGQRLGFDGELAAEARRLIGENGTDLPARLGVDPRATADDLWQLSSDALARWQEQAEDPVLSVDQRRAARVVVRSCEGMLARLQSA